MDNKKATLILKNYVYHMTYGMDKDYSIPQKKQVQDAIQYCIDKLERESAYYCNLPKGGEDD